jgi:hypothetical protein
MALNDGITLKEMKGTGRAYKVISSYNIYISSYNIYISSEDSPVGTVTRLQA